MVSGGGWPDEVGEGRDCLSRDSQARADVMVEGHFELHAGVGEAEHDIAGVAAPVGDGSARDFSLRDEGADVVFRGVGPDDCFAIALS